MFGLTFAIYGGMTVFSLLVFAVELMVGKRSKTMEKPQGDQDNGNYGQKSYRGQGTR